MGSLVKNNLKEDFRSWQFWVVVVMAMVILFFAPPIWGMDENKNLLQEIWNLRKNTDMSMWPDGMWNYNICYITDHMLHWSFLYMILPLVGLPAIIRFCEENSSGFSRMLILRRGTKQYLIANLISGGIVAFVGVILTMLLSFFIMGAILPAMGSNAVEQMEMENALYGWMSAYQGGFWYVLLRAGTAGMMVAFAVQIALLVATLNENKFLSVAVSMTVLETWKQYTLGRTSLSPQNLLAPWSIVETNLVLSIVEHFVPLALVLILGTCAYFLYYERKVKHGE